jgi:hypothetical protein
LGQTRRRPGKRAIYSRAAKIKARDFRDTAIGSALRLVINQADPVSNIAVPMFKIMDAVQIAANAGSPNAPNRERTRFANERMAMPSLAILAVCASQLTAVPVYSRGGKKIVRMSKRFKTCVSCYGKN